MKKYNNYIGVDPAFRKGGFSVAIITPKGKLVEFRTFKEGFLQFQDFIRTVDAWWSETVICIENSNLQNKTFDMQGSKGVVARKSRNAGTNQAVSQLSVDFCKLQTNLVTIGISPKEKGKKWTRKTALAVMEQEGLSTNSLNLSQDEIDALQIALKGKQLSRMRIKT